MLAKHSKHFSLQDSLAIGGAVGKSGKVLPVYILRFPLYVLRTRPIVDGRHNIDTILGDPDDPHLRAGCVDAVLVANTYCLRLAV